MAESPTAMASGSTKTGEWNDSNFEPEPPELATDEMPRQHLASIEHPTTRPRLARLYMRVGTDFDAAADLLVAVSIFTAQLFLTPRWWGEGVYSPLLL